ncbi:helix-turn-helix domain-containing protein [Hoyosella subflava]|uniref:Putative transcriptional regulator n=1 Tax=Hoyosella subflava (strain DSM 45089 / JCM 17490 / NBRC 109087 / DQS3-9A1) TaxID=443218 RepID=F6EHG1_HOYSD|nr:helix-turn-helix domain-containing protein [Hoyosella subflava]AEF41140.1 Putative transcriptional regulator [Hoyosella subflava DQS3-9A1]
MTAPVMEFARGSMRIPGIAAAYGYRSEGLSPGVHRGLPSQYVTFIISLDDPIETAASAEDLAAGVTLRNEVVISGLHTSPAYVRQPEHQAGVQLAVHPLLARQLFGVPVGELSELTYEGAGLLGRGIGLLREELHELPTWQQRFDTLRDYLHRRLDATAKSPRRELFGAWNHLAATGGAATAGQVADVVNLSSRRLTDLFRNETGISPKDAGRLIRFDRAITLVGASLRGGHTPVFADVAAECGFYDHAHLVREFRRFTGTTPTRWLAEEFQNLQAGGHDRREK